LIFKNMKKSFWLFLLISSFSVILAGCCKTCLLSRAELSSIKTVTHAGNQNSIQITAGNKSAIIIPNEDGKIIDYSVNNENILSSKEATGLSLTLNNTKTASLPFISSITKSGVSYTNSTDDLTEIHSFDMNFNNGDLFETYKVNNQSAKTLYSSTKLNVNLNGHGFILLPDDNSILSNSNFISSAYDKIGEVITKHNENFIINSSKLVGNSFEVEPNSGWFAYVNKRSMLLVNYDTFTRSNAAYKPKLEVFVDKNGIRVVISCNTFKIMPKSVQSIKIKYIIVELKNDVNSESEMALALSKIGIPLLLSR